MRPANPWARFKLGIVECYLPGFSRACAGAGRHCVVDAFAGPGLNQFTDDGEVRPGTPLPRLRAALEQRTARYGGRAVVCDGDANRDLLALMRAHLDDWPPVLVVFDPEGTELAFKTVAAVSRWRRGRTKAELLILLATHTGFLRLLWEATVRTTYHHGPHHLHRPFWS